MRTLLRLLLPLTLLCALLGTVAGGAVAAPDPTIVYDSTVQPLPPNLPSLGYQATQTAEFGDRIRFAGTARGLQTVVVTMSDWAKHADYPALPAEGFTHPITLNLYAVNTQNPALPGALLATRTQSFLIPWRPAADPTCPNGGTAWRASDNQCYNGYAFTITFDMSSLNLTLPDELVFGIAYNTNTWGAQPIGQPGPYESLNVGLAEVPPTGTAPTVGTDVDSDAVFWNTKTAAWYADGGAGGVGIFRQDTNWTPYTPAVRFTVRPLATELVAVGGSGTYGQGATLTATLRDAATHQPVGAGYSVEFHLGAAPGSYVCGGVTDTNGVASCTATWNQIKPLNAGTYSGHVHAYFYGAGIYLASQGHGDLALAKGTLWLKPSNQTVSKAEINTPAKFASRLPSGNSCPIEWVSLPGTGLPAGEALSAAVNTQYLRCTYGATSASVPGSYPIVGTGVTSTNYLIKWQTGTLKITP